VAIGLPCSLASAYGRVHELQFCKAARPALLPEAQG